MNKAIWYFRNNPTVVQLDQAKKDMGFEIVGIDEGILMGRKGLNNEADVDNLFEMLSKAAKHHKAVAIFGVFPTPVLARLVTQYISDTIPDHSPTLLCFSPWLITEKKDGVTETHKLKEWVMVGAFTPEIK